MQLSITPSPWSFPRVPPTVPVDTPVATAVPAQTREPDPVAWSAARALHEIALGSRPVSHLEGRATPLALDRLVRLIADNALADSRLTGVRSQRPLGQGRHIEVVASLQAPRGRAVIAMRLDRSAGRWLITELAEVSRFSPAPARGRP